jgi:hypothetical protein
LKNIGIFLTSDGKKYEGDFFDDTFTGFGRLTLPNGTVIRGKFKNFNFIQ